MWIQIKAEFVSTDQEIDFLPIERKEMPIIQGGL
jgi:hypothetical protein